MAQQHTVFVSHAHADNALCDRYVAALRARGLDVWYDRTNMQDGHFLSTDIERELEQRTAFVVLLTPASVASYWVNLEVSAFRSLASRDSKRMMLPVRIADCRVPLLMTGIKWLDAVSLGFDSAIDAMTAAFAAPANPAPPSTTSAAQLAEGVDALITQGKALITQRKFAEAVPILIRATLLAPARADGWAYLGRAYSGAGNPEDGLAASDRALALDSASAVTWYAKGGALWTLQKSNEALAHFDQALALDPTYALAWIGRAAALSKLGRYDESLAAIEQALIVDFNHAMAWNNKGYALHELKRYSEALIALDRALTLDPKLAIAWTNKAITLRSLGRTAEAEEAEQQARELGG